MRYITPGDAPLLFNAELTGTRGWLTAPSTLQLPPLVIVQALDPDSPQVMN